MSALDLVCAGEAASRVRREATWATLAVATMAAAVAVAPAGAALAAAAAAGVGMAAWLAGGASLAPRAVRRALLSLAALVVVANALFLPGEPLRAGPLVLPGSREGLWLGLWTALRASALVLLFRAWFLAVDAAELAAAVTRWAPPESGAVPAGLAVSFARRSLPAFAREARRLGLQRALRRGWPGPGLSARERARRLRLGWPDLPSVVVPLVLLGLRRAEQVSLALAARYAGAAAPTPPEPRPVRAAERLWLVAGALALGGAVAARLWSA